MTPEMKEILNCFAKEHGWLFGNLNSFRGQVLWGINSGFRKQFKFIPQHKSYWNPFYPEGSMRINWLSKNPTVIILYHPKMRLKIGDEQYEEPISHDSQDVLSIDLVNPDSLENITRMLDRTGEEINSFCKQTIDRHLVGKKHTRKQRKQDGKKGRRDR